MQNKFNLSELKQVVVCLIATRSYKVYVQPLVDSIKKYFLLNHIVEIHLFIDDINFPVHGDERVVIYKELIPSYTFPTVTLYRYAIMCSKTYVCDYLYYLDVDYLIVDTIDEDIFGNIVAILHPGFAEKKGGSWCDDKNSNAYTHTENRIIYAAGGTQGGAYEYYYRAMKLMALLIDDDEKRGVKAEWNDEATWNFYLSQLNDFKILGCEYCMVQSAVLRMQWGINHISPKILALDKDHKKMRE